MPKPVVFTYGKKRSYNDYQSSMFDRIIQDVSNSKKKRVPGTLPVKPMSKSDEYDFSCESDSRLRSSLLKHKTENKSPAKQKPSKKKPLVVKKVI
jgi:hypothetical protein